MNSIGEIDINSSNEYPVQRNHYKNYTETTYKINDLLLEFHELKTNETKKAVDSITKKSGLTRSTLLRYYSIWLENKDFDFSKERRGGSNKLLDYENEKKLANLIIEVFINGFLYLTNQHIKILAVKQYHLMQLEINKDYIKEEFLPSDVWATNFNKRWNFSSQKIKLNKKAVYVDPFEIDIFLEECKEAFNKYQHCLISNFDESFWRWVNLNGKVIGIKNSGGRTVNVNVDPKKGFTTIFTIFADGTSIKPIIIMKGTTYRCLEKIKDIDDNEVTKKFSVNGWIDENILISLLNDISVKVNGKECALMLDRYSVHKNPKIKETADLLKIKLIYVPTGMTSKYQPLDVGYIGTVKSAGKKLINEMFIENPHQEITLINTIENMLEANKKMKPETIIKSFQKACFNIF